MKTLIYARFSSAMQNPRSCADQIAACRQRAEAEGWQIAGEYHDDAISGAAGIEDTQRPGLAALLSHLERGGIDQVLTEATDRIARHQGDAFAVRERIEYAGARLFTLMDGHVDDITGTIKGLFDARARKDIAARVRRGQAGNVREGRSSSGVAFGYRRVARFDEAGDAIRGLREVDEQQAAIVRRIFRDYANGMSARAIATALNAEGIPSPRGGIWRASTLAGHRKHGTAILTNPIYVGRLAYGRTKMKVDPRTRRRQSVAGDGPVETGEAPHLRIVDDATFEEVQRQLEARSFGRPERQRRPKHLLSGLGVCGVCGSRMVITRPTYFGCGGANDGSGCANRRLIKKDEFQRRVLDDLRAQMLAPDVVAAYLDEYRAEHAEQARRAARERGQLARRKSAAEARVQRLVAAIADGGAEFAEIGAALASAKTEVAECDRALAAADALPQLALHPGLARQYEQAVANLAEELEDEATRAEAAPKIRSLIARVIVTPSAAKRGVDLEVIRHIEEILHLATPKTATR